MLLESKLSYIEKFLSYIMETNFISSDSEMIKRQIIV
jgi:hypothetical protein